MARPLRFIPPDSVVEVTCRTIQGRLLLRPSPALNDLVLGVLGRALFLYPKIRVHAFVFASNHVHLLLSVPDARELASFMNHFNSNVAREAGRLHAWREKLWGRRYRAIVVADELAQVDRLRYILAHGVKERLVARPRDWPGVSSLRALTEGALLSGNWVDRTREASHQRRSARATADCGTNYLVSLAPLPCWGHLSPDEHRAHCADLVSQIEGGLRETTSSGEPNVLGPAMVMNQHPHSRPRLTKRTPAPSVHALTANAREAFRAAQHAFLEAFRTAAASVKDGLATVEFPPFAFPPRSPFKPAAQAAVREGDRNR
jgi:REP element-mobilizing transposase RayT